MRSGLDLLRVWMELQEGPAVVTRQIRPLTMFAGFWAYWDGGHVDLWQVPATDVRAILTRERSDLLKLLDDLTPEEWHAPTAAPGWSVKDVALHLLDDDLGWLSRDRDGDHSGLLDPGVDAFVAALAAKNEAWVRGAYQLSARVVAGLLEWAGREMDDFYAGMDIHGRVMSSGPATGQCLYGSTSRKT